MRSIIDMDNIQIEVTNACHMSCSNCTRFCGHREPFFMDLDYFKHAVDVMVDYPKITGIMGGEPLLHPQFEQICEYALSKLPKEKLGLWSSFPDGKEHYNEVICETFGHIFLNDHARPDIYHCPILVAAEEVLPIREEMFWAIDHCWLQKSWSASINPFGAYFCEIAASLALLFDEPEDAWVVDDKWWLKTPKDFREQIERFCPRCGVALPLPRRPSRDGRDDISQGNYERLKNISRKLKHGKYVISDLKGVEHPQPMAAYKDPRFREAIARRYGIFLIMNDKGYQTPYLMSKNYKPTENLLSIVQREFQENYSL